MDALPFLPFDQIELKPPAGDFTANIVTGQNLRTLDNKNDFYKDYTIVIYLN